MTWALVLGAVWTAAAIVGGLLWARAGLRRPALPQRHPGAAFTAQDDALDQLRQAIDDYETCLAIDDITQHTHPHRKEN